MLFLLAVAFPAAALAQQDAAGRVGGLFTARSDLSGLRPSGDLNNPTFAPYVEGDEDLGVQLLLGEPDSYRPWRILGAAGVYWTDNAALTETFKLEDVYFNAILRADYLPKFKENLYGSFYTSYEFYRYDDNTLLDFDDQQLGLGLAAAFPDHGDVTIYGRYNYERILEVRNYTELYTNNSFVVGLYKPFIIDRKQFAYTRLESDFGFATNPSSLRRFEYGLTLGYRNNPCEKIAIDIYYRLRFFDYQNLSGTDWNHQPGLSVSYLFNESLRFSASTYWAFNDSSRAVGDYTSTNLGGFLSLQLKF